MVGLTLPFVILIHRCSMIPSCGLVFKSNDEQRKYSSRTRGATFEKSTPRDTKAESRHACVYAEADAGLLDRIRLAQSLLDQMSYYLPLKSSLRNGFGGQPIPQLRATVVFDGVLTGLAKVRLPNHYQTSVFGDRMFAQPHRRGQKSTVKSCFGSTPPAKTPSTHIPRVCPDS